MEQVATLNRTWNLVPVLQLDQKISEKYCSCLYLLIDQVWWVNELWFKRYIQKCFLSHVLIVMMTSQIWLIMGCLNTKTWISWEQNITFLWDKKILNVYLRRHILRSYHFVGEVTLSKYLCHAKRINQTFSLLW